jgi:hypothetical protein
MFPAERGQVGEKLVRYLLDLAHGGDGALKVSGIPEDNRGDEEVEAGGAVLLVLVSEIADFSESMDEDRSRQAIA